MNKALSLINAENQEDKIEKLSQQVDELMAIQKEKVKFLSTFSEQNRIVAI